MAAADLSGDAVALPGTVIPGGFLGSNVTIAPAPPPVLSPSAPPPAPAASLPPPGSGADLFATDALALPGTHPPEGFMGSNVTILPAPPRADDGTPGAPPLVGGDEPGGDPLRGFVLDDPFASRSLQGANPPLKGFGWVSAMVDLAALYRLDYLAVAADVLGEGHAGTVGDSGWAYGPFQDHLTQFSGRPFYGKGRDNPTVNAWAWSRNGLDYSMRMIAFGEAAARDLKGQAALAAIVRHYEKPKDIPGQISVRGATLRNLQAMGDQWLPYLAGRMLGPVGGSGVDNVPVIGLPPKPSGSPKPTKQWSSMLHFLANDVPQAGGNARRAGARVHDAVRSTLWRTPTG